MGKRKRRSFNPDDRFFKVEHRLLRKPAFLDLTGNSVKLFLFMYARFNGSNNGKIGFSVREAAAILGTSKDTAARCFRELHEHGFIDIETRGSDFDQKTRRSTEWRITLERSNGMGATHDYEHWAPGANAIELAVAARETGKQAIARIKGHVPPQSDHEDTSERTPNDSSVRFKGVTVLPVGRHGTIS